MKKVVAHGDPTNGENGGCRNGDGGRGEKLGLGFHV